MTRPAECLLALAWLVVHSALPAGAITYDVSTPEELQDAFDDLASGDVVRLAADIAVASPLEIRWATGVTLTSVPGRQHALDGGSLRTILLIKQYAQVDITSVKFRNGRGAANAPGALSIQWSSTVRLDSVVFSGNSVGGFTAEGGALTVKGSTVVMERCEFLDNAVDAGAGGSAVKIEDASVNVTDCAFHDNVANGGMGGALYLGSRSTSGALSVVVRDSTFYSNVHNLGVGGGAVMIQAYRDRKESVALIGCSFAGNAGAAGAHDVAFAPGSVAPDAFVVQSSCEAGSFDAGWRGALSCDSCPGGPYPAALPGSCTTCNLHIPDAGRWTCDAARCSSMRSTEASFCAAVNRSALVEDAEGVQCSDATCLPSDAERCCAAPCSSIDDEVAFCGDYHVGLVEDPGGVSCAGLECNATVDAFTCCAVSTTTTRASTTSTFTTSTLGFWLFTRTSTTTSTNASEAEVTSTSITTTSTTSATATFTTTPELTNSTTQTSSTTTTSSTTRTFRIITLTTVTTTTTVPENATTTMTRLRGAAAVDVGGTPAWVVVGIVLASLCVLAPLSCICYLACKGSPVVPLQEGELHEGEADEERPTSAPPPEASPTDQVAEVLSQLRRPQPPPRPPPSKLPPRPPPPKPGLPAIANSSTVLASAHGGIASPTVPLRQLALASPEPPAAAPAWPVAGPAQEPPRLPVVS